MRAMASFALLGVITLTGCAQAMRLPMPDAMRPLSVKVSSDRPSKASEMPAGIHQIPDTSVYISGYQGESMKVTSAKKSDAAQGQLRIDVRAATERLLAEQLRTADRTRLVGAGAPGAGVLEIVPYVVVSSTGNDQARPWLFLRTTLRDAAGDEKWKTRYIVSLGQPRALTGANGWASGDGASLRAAVDEGLRTGIALMLRDASGGLPRTGRPVRIRTQWPWVKEPLEHEADLLEETPSKLIVLPKVVDGAVFAGISVLDKGAVTVSAVQK